MRSTRRHSLRAAAITAVVMTVFAVGTGTAHAVPIEEAYGTGPTPHPNVVYTNDGDPASDPCDPEDGPAPTAPNTIVYPTTLGGAGGTEDHPIVVWGNGTNLWSVPDVTCYYRPLLEHWARWGFVVVAPNNGWVGDGTAMLSAAQTMVALNSDPSSIFYGKLDTTEIGAIGHSQGADGAINATIASNGLINSTVTLDLLDRDAWPRFGATPPDVTQLTDPVFYIKADDDSLSTNAGTREYYDDTPGPRAIGRAEGGSHSYMPNTVGYATAWLRYTLYDDGIARGAFVGSPPEIASSPNWCPPAEPANCIWDGDGLP